MNREDLHELDADEVNRVWINSSNVSIYTDEGVVRLRGILQARDNDYRYVAFNGAEIHTTCSTYDPAIEITTVEEFEYHRLDYQDEEYKDKDYYGEIEEEQLRVTGNGKIRS
jgi:hypothetical protein